MWLMKLGDSASSSLVGTVVPELGAAVSTVRPKATML